MGYYCERLSGERLRECYAIAPPRVRQYLAAEIEHLLTRLEPGDAVLELGCGYGRVALKLARVAARVVGIDTARESLKLARDLAGAGSACEFIEMDATDMRFGDGEFDAVACIQNGICAFGVDRLKLVREALRVTRPGGSALFSSYTDEFWEARLEWFELQAARGLLGEIDREATGGGTIVCMDGFRAGTMDRAAFETLGREAGIAPLITEIDGSSLFCELVKPAAG